MKNKFECKRDAEILCEVHTPILQKQYLFQPKKNEILCQGKCISSLITLRWIFGRKNFNIKKICYQVWSKYHRWITKQPHRKKTVRYKYANSYGTSGYFVFWHLIYSSSIFVFFFYELFWKLLVEIFSYKWPS